MHSQLVFNNNFISLHAKSMGKLHHIVRLKEHKLDLKNGLIQVSELFGRPAVAKLYPSKQFLSSNIRSDSLTGFYIKADKKYYGVSFVTQSQKLANKFMNGHDSCGVIATDNDGFHYIVTTAESI